MIFSKAKKFHQHRRPPEYSRHSCLDTVLYLTNETIMQLTAVPEHLLILGGGYIGLEFGQMFRRFGSRVTVLQHWQTIVPREDPEIAAELQKALEAEGISSCSIPAPPASKTKMALSLFHSNHLRARRALPARIS